MNKGSLKWSKGAKKPSLTNEIKTGYLLPLFVLVVLSLVCIPEVKSQGVPYSRQDSLRGSITPERAWWDLVYYHLDIEVDPKKRSIEGKNTVFYQVIQSGKTLQIDLQYPMEIGGFFQDGQILPFEKEGNAYFVSLEKEQVPGETYALEIKFGGSPRVSTNPPWSGGITWKKTTRANLSLPIPTKGMVPAFGGHARTTCMMNRTAC
jgi:hypothetical protein